MGVPEGTFYSWKQRYGKVNEHNGWIPRDQMGATADCALSTMLNKGKSGYTLSDLEPTTRDWQKAQKALVWAHEELASRDRLPTRYAYETANCIPL